MKAKAGSRTGDSLAAGGRMKAKAGSRTGDSLAAGGWMKAKARGEEEKGRQGPQQSQAPPRAPSSSSQGHLQEGVQREAPDAMQVPVIGKAGREKWKSQVMLLEGGSTQGTS
ncbi:hypothetical protein CFC21_079812 [Triticum aestivum]|uniref:Uncharacterized protein n=2 Tax=Triticum aestivum TaxID=4565 RepID=A0A9R1I0Y7_WHEAT|nr:hypothetical protein CFC21_079812 [Triticum aestivum]